jgi:hypothetical protein
MRMRRVPALIVAAVIGGAGLTACAASPANPAAAASSASVGETVTVQVAPTATPTRTRTPGPSPTPEASPTPTIIQSTAAEPSVTATATEAKSPSAKASPSQSSPASGTHDFTVPAISGDNVVTAYGSYTFIGTARVKVTVCAKQTGSAFSVGAIALVYNSSGGSQNIGATILTGPGNSTCVNNTFILYTAHLKVHAFIGGSGGTIVKTGPVLTVY